MININNKNWNQVDFNDIDSLLQGLDGENYFFEFKNESTNNKGFIKEVCAFANTYGGYILLGVEDNKQITGCTTWDEERITNTIHQSITPTPNFDIKRIIDNNGNVILIVKVESGALPPYITSDGNVYERIHSSACIINDSAKLNQIFNKSESKMKEMQNKISISKPDITPENVCVYYDLGFVLITKNPEAVYDKILETDFEKIKNLEISTLNKFSISRVGYSLFFTLGEMSCNQGKIVPPADLHNFMEIKADGSVRLRIILNSNENPNVVDMSPLWNTMSYFKEISSIVFGEAVFENFICAYKYEQLNVIKQFTPTLNGINKYREQVEQLYLAHKEKYGDNLIVSGNRIPSINLLPIDSKWLKFHRGDNIDSEKLYDELFFCSYMAVGFIDQISTDDKTSE